MTSDNDVRIGFYICHCGRNIADTVDVEVTAVGSAKSINGGRLLITPLVSPHRLDAPPFGFAEGLVRCPDTEMLRILSWGIGEAFKRSSTRSTASSHIRGSDSDAPPSNPWMTPPRVLY